MKVSRRVLARHIAAELHAGKKRQAILESLAAYIVTHKLQAEQEQIMADIAANLTSLGYVEASVTTARPLDASLRKELVDYVKQMENASNVTLHEYVDERLLGGVIIETPKHRFDASVSTKLKRLKNA